MKISSQDIQGEVFLSSLLLASYLNHFLTYISQGYQSSHWLPYLYYGYLILNSFTWFVAGSHMVQQWGSTNICTSIWEIQAQVSSRTF